MTQPSVSILDPTKTGISEGLSRKYPMWNPEVESPTKTHCNQHYRIIFCEIGNTCFSLEILVDHNKISNYLDKLLSWRLHNLIQSETQMDQQVLIQVIPSVHLKFRLSCDIAVKAKFHIYLKHTTWCFIIYSRAELPKWVKVFWHLN